MTGVVVAGTGAVSPAGWGTEALWLAVKRGAGLPTESLPRPGREEGLAVRSVPRLVNRPAFAAHPRLRRASPISQYAVGSALEALGADAGGASQGRVGIIFCVMSGCVNYSRRFYTEVLQDPAMASPLIFPETVFNAPSSHLAALLGCKAINYTLVGDPGTFLQGLALAADWLLHERVDGCLVIGAEEKDWLTADAGLLFDRKVVISEGAGAIYLKRTAATPGSIVLESVTDAFSFHGSAGRRQAAENMRGQLSPARERYVLCDGLTGARKWDAVEEPLWRNYGGERISPKRILGEGLMAAAAWQGIAAICALREQQGETAGVSIVGCNQQAIGAQFRRVQES